jgi:hypothetical protein
MSKDFSTGWVLQQATEKITCCTTRNLKIKIEGYIGTVQLYYTLYIVSKMRFVEGMLGTA